MADDLPGYRLASSPVGPVGAIDAYEAIDKEIIYIDGFHNVAVGPFVARLSAFSVIRSENDADGKVKETRKISMEIVVPSGQLIEVASGVLLAALKNSDVLNQSTKMIKDKLDQMKTFVKAT